MEEILVFQHDPFEDLGVFAELIVLGGPMSVQDEATCPFLRWEKRIIHAAVNDGVPILGVSLGAQLIASTLGTSIYRGPVKEIGCSSVSITPYGQVDSLLGYLPENATVFQWHSDGFELPLA
jgi:GMP synthase (glutamine-hydrolysing)